jgi:hypothetical protein
VLKTLRNIFVAVVVLAVAGGGLYEWWSLDLRWRPHEVKADQDEIGKALRGAGWVSPGGAGPKLYVLAYRASAPSQRVIGQLLPQLQKAGVDTRVIMIARADSNGASQSTAVERSTVAELWVNRRWSLFQQWMAAAPETWNAPGVPDSDGDVARNAVVEVGQALADKLAPILRRSGVKMDYPLLVWWGRDGKMRALVDADPRNDRFVLKDLGAG